MNNNDHLSHSARSQISPKGGRREKMTSRDLFWVALSCFAAAFFTAIVESCFFFNFRPFGFAPDLCLALSVAVGVKFGPKCGGSVGLMAGFFIDAFSSSGFSLSIIFYMLMGVIFGIIASPETESAIHPSALFLIGVGVGSSVTALVSLIKICVTSTSVMVTDVIFGTLFPEMLITLAFSLLLYLPTALIWRCLRKKQGLSPK